MNLLVSKLSSVIDFFNSMNLDFRLGLSNRKYLIRALKRVILSVIDFSNERFLSSEPW